MQKTSVLFITFLCLIFLSCSKNDDNNTNNYPRVSNIKYEIITSKNTSAEITTTLNNEEQSHYADDMPFSIVYAQTDINQGTYVKLTFQEISTGIGGSTNWEDYTAELRMYENNDIIKTQTFDITLDNLGVKSIDFAFE